MRSSLTCSVVKFDGAKLPPILNALQCTNNNQKLVLEVAVRRNTEHPPVCSNAPTRY